MSVATYADQSAFSTASESAIDKSSRSKSSSKKKTHRVQLELPSKSMERLDDLKDLTGASSYAEVIRNSIRLYEDMAKEASSGQEFLIRDQSGNISKYRAFLEA